MVTISLKDMFIYHWTLIHSLDVTHIIFLLQYKALYLMQWWFLTFSLNDPSNHRFTLTHSYFDTNITLFPYGRTIQEINWLSILNPHIANFAAHFIVLSQFSKYMKFDYLESRIMIIHWNWDVIVQLLYILRSSWRSQERRGGGRKLVKTLTMP